MRFCHSTVTSWRNHTKRCDCMRSDDAYVCTKYQVYKPQGRRAILQTLWKRLRANPCAIFSSATVYASTPIRRVMHWLLGWYLSCGQFLLPTHAPSWMGGDADTGACLILAPTLQSSLSHRHGRFVRFRRQMGDTRCPTDTLDVRGVCAHQSDLHEPSPV